MSGSMMHHLRTVRDKVRAVNPAQAMFWTANMAALLFCMALPKVNNRLLFGLLVVLGVTTWLLWMQQHTEIEKRLALLADVARWQREQTQIRMLAWKRLKDESALAAKPVFLIGMFASAWVGTALIACPGFRLGGVVLLTVHWGLVFLVQKRLAKMILNFAQGERGHEHHGHEHGHGHGKCERGHEHQGHHHHTVEEMSPHALRFVTMTNAVLVLVQFVGLLLSGSLIQFGDALHTTSDTVSYGLGWYSRTLSQRQAGGRMPYGYAALTHLLAACSSGMLVASCMYVLWEAFQHLAGHGRPMHPLITLGVGLISIALGVWNSRRLGRDEHQDSTIQVARLHELSDIVLSLVVVIVSLLAWITPWRDIDAILSLLIVNNLALGAWRLVREQVGIITREAPFDVDYCSLLLQWRLEQERLPFQLVARPLASRVSERVLSVELPLAVQCAWSGDVSELERLQRSVEHVLHNQLGVEAKLQLFYNLTRR